ncbi:hypothetical protein COCCU_11485 [Corynebacterium occultum]|uniref:PhoU domain-containing protein n=1 Tax=Corynebacterium occultum TaxID=2675219 RepID=A0A6B8WPB9_9CORY|nr:phosphate signaling complex protein PhoU [Corynebacterium occultum]QGU08198.1 hypothetical protein COCCU_11485 [Corynebacterium occultum]
MRTAYREHLDSFAHDLIIMCDLVQDMMSYATEALLQASLESAESALSLTDELKEIRTRCDERAVELLALEGPVARDLRQVISSIYIVEDFHRMGALAMHIASSARRRHPEQAIPRSLLGYFEEYGRLCRDMSNKTRALLVEPDPDIAVMLTDEDDAVDDLNDHLLTMLTQREWKYSTREAIDTAMASRFYERYADHCVNVAGHIVYLATGFIPEEYLAKREKDEAQANFEARFAALEKQFHRR